MKSILAALALPASASEMDACAAIDKQADERKSLLAATETESVSEAVAKITGWKIAASEAKELREKFAKQEAEAKEREFTMALEAAITSGVIPPSPEHKKHQMALKFKGQPDAVAMLKEFCEALGPAATAPVHVVASEPAMDSAVILTAQDKEFARKMGLSLEAYKQTKIRQIARLAERQEVISDEE